MLGIYYKTISRNWESGETIFLVTPREACTYAVDGLLKCCGRVGVYTKGIPLELEGTFDANRGMYFVTSDTLTIKTEESTVELLDYITSDLTEKQKEKICSVSGNDLFSFAEEKKAADILMDDVFNGSAKAGRLTKLILKTIRELKEREKITKELMSYGIPIDRIQALHKKDITLNSLDKNPYIIMLKFEIPIDAVEVYACNRLKIKEYSTARLCGFLYDSMLYISKNGDTCCTLKNITRTMNMRMRYHGAYATVVDEALANLCVSLMPDEMSYREVGGVPYIYLKHIWEEETIAVSHIKRLQSERKEYTYGKFSIADVECHAGITYNKDQRNVFNALRTSGIKILTGPPGSGKTAVIKGLMNYFEKNGNGTVHLSATTGMAAKVMSNACGADAETVNLMLDVRPYDSSVKGRDLNNPVEADFIIVDETSMLGLQLFSVLVRAVKNGSILLLVGDYDQLQSVDYGNVLHDLIDSGCVETYRLTEILRQSGTICGNAVKINSGNHRIDTDNTFRTRGYRNPQSLLDDLKRNFVRDKSQILCPIKNGETGTFSLNQMFQDQTRTFVASYGKKIFRVGDRVIMTKTNYEKGYINGDMGHVIGSGTDEGMLVKFGDVTMSIDRLDLRNVELADAITVHKSQGSEFDDIHIVLPAEASHMMTRRILYTGVTRARKTVRIYYMNNALDMAISDSGEKKRNTMLGRRLEHGDNG